MRLTGEVEKKLKAKNCRICGDLFTPKTANSRYCSPECRNQKRKSERKEWLENNPEYMKKYMRDYRSK